MKITLYDTEPWEKVAFQKSLRNHKLKFFSGELKISHLPKIKDTEILVTFIEPEITRKIIDSLPKLKLIVTMSTGFDHIDISYAKTKKINVSNIPFYGENTVAEQAFALILALSRKLYPSIKRTHENRSFQTDESLRGFDLKNKTLGIIGLGHIGQHVAQIARGFQMNILAYEPHKKPKLEKKFGLKYVPLKTLLKNSDIITLHVPYLKSTHHLISKPQLSLLKKTAIIINTSRGPIIDTTALLPFLKSKKIAGAGLDVLEEEDELGEHYKKKRPKISFLENHQLMKLDNVIITPHNAFNTQEALERILNTTIENIKSFVKGKPKNLV
jgi:D-lactate dehydrogenase